MTRAYLVDGTRTPIGRYGGVLATVRPDDMAAHVIRALMTRHPAAMAEALDEVILAQPEERREPRELGVGQPHLPRPAAAGGATVALSMDRAINIKNQFKERVPLI